MRTLRFILPALGLALAGCSAPPPPLVFQPLDYSYLPPITLKVATLNVVNNYVPTPAQATLDGQSPAPPGSTLLAMLNRRLVPSGQPGSGTVTVQMAAINEAGGNLSGQMTVDVNLLSADGRSTGFTEASVTASQTAPDSDASQDDRRAALYGMTKKLMDAMNVQLQYQIQRNLKSWTVWNAAPGAVSAPGGNGVIQAAPLGASTGSFGAAKAAPVAAAATQPPASQVNTTPGVPNYLPGAGPAALGQGAAQ